MRAMILTSPRTPLALQDVPKPLCNDQELLIRVRACGVCRTDLHIKDGELSHPNLPLILGHEIVGVVEEVGKQVKGFALGDRVGIPWLASSCGKCSFCLEGRENLCDHALYTGYQVNGGFAEYTTCRAEFALHLPAQLSDEQFAPLLCAGLIGFRAYRKASPQKTLGLYGFGASAHLLTQLATHEGKEVYAFTKDHDHEGQEFAISLGAVWAGSSTTSPPKLLDAVIIFAPVGDLVPIALRALKKGGRCICAGIHMSDIPSFPYSDLWGERSIHSIANLTRDDAREFFAKLSSLSLHPHVTSFPLEQANQALEDVRLGKLEGAAVICL